MNDLQLGRRDRRGDWTPEKALENAPLFVFPPRPLALLRWLPHYFLPWNVLFMLSAVLFWHALTPDVATLQTLDWGWVLAILARNCVAVLLFYGALELRLYVKRAQGNRFKYNARFPADRKSSVFLLGSQGLDSLVRTFATGVPIWTAYEVLILWTFANGWVPWLTFTDNLWYLAALGLVVPIVHEVHFYLVHRLIHTPLLYKHVHSVHHNSVNPSPWSSLSMHPVEHLLYFSGALLHLIVPSSPILALYHLHYAGLGAVVGHIGFDRIELTGTTAIDSHAYTHYLHHKYFEVNYADGLIPLDRWLGTWHDGTAAGDALMEARHKERKQRMKAAA